MADPDTLPRAAGTTYDVRDGKLVRVVDRAGHVWATLEWDGDELAQLTVPGASVDGGHVDDPLLGLAHPITSGDAGTTMSALDWAQPTEIPTVAAPGRLAGGAGGAILNVLALLAAHAGVPALRYAGPYPTSALYRSLLRSFRASGSEETFTATLATRMAMQANAEIAIDFAPAPHERVGHPHGLVEVRDGAVERAVIDRVSYEPGGSPARLVAVDGGGARAELWFGDAVYAHVATLAPDGALLDGPHPIPRCTSPVIGQAFPAELAAALAELVAEAVPAPIADTARRWLTTHPIRWADLGARAAQASDAGADVHAAIWEALGPHGLARLALALAEALAPVVTTVIAAALARDVDPMSPRR